MPITLELFYSVFVIITSLAVGLALFFYLRKNQILTPVRFFFWHYAVGFLVWGLSQLIPLFVNLGIQISYPFLVGLSIISFLALMSAYLFFYRGAILLFTKNRFVTTVFPLIFGSLFASFFTVAVLVDKFESSAITTLAFWGFILPVNLFLGCVFLYSFIKGTPLDTMERKPYVLILSFAWFYVFVLNIILWFNLVTYPREFYLLRFATSEGWLLARTIGHLLILVGFILYSRYLYRLSIAEVVKLIKKAKTFTPEQSKK